MPSHRPQAADLAALGALAAAVLAFEVVLLRLFEFSHWHHFAGLTIALALLGLGSAGTVLALVGDRAVRAGDRWFVGGMIVAAAGFLFVLWLHSRIALRPVFAAWDASELVRVLAVDLAAFIPFFGAGLAIGQVFPRWPGSPHRLYAANLFGSGLGAVAGTGLLAVMAPEAALAVIAAAIVAGALALALVRRVRWAVVAAFVLLVPACFWINDPPQPRVSDFKALAMIGDLPGARVLARAPGLAGRLTVLRAPSLRHAPGLSLNWTGEVTGSDAAVIGSDRVVAMPRDFSQPPIHAPASIAMLPLRLRAHGAVLVLGSSTISTPWLAAGRDVTWVEPDRRLTRLARTRGARFEASGDGALRFLATGSERFDLIAFDAPYAPGDAASESPLLTVEGLAAALDRLAPGGLLSIVIRIEYPPRNGPRLLATLAGALQAAGFEAPGRHVAAIRGLQSMLVVAGRQPFAPADLERIESFAGRWSFDRVWLPGMSPETANRHHVLDEPAFHAAAAAVFADRPMPAAARWFVTRPATLTRPYFWRAMRWSRVPALFEAMGRRAASLLDWTLVMSALATAAVIALAALLIVAPLGRLPAPEDQAARPGRPGAIGYFLALGLGFMFVEMAVFQRAIVFLDRPVLAAAVVFSLFLVGAGIGSAMPARAPGATPVFASVAAGGVLAAAGLWLAPGPLLALPLPGRIAAIAFLLFPMVWAMGRPFPWALARLAARPGWMPWAWGINGFASVAAASIAPLISVEYGQPATLAAGAASYTAAWATARRWTARGGY